ncbi:preprotein translocase subunit SecD [Bradyrhizobium shewense]|uniref:Preprotein translocase subunit SecD n=2 Tax=Bradyrhizobium TaxID=374 RepID=A0A1C3XQE5_9BRAD|nr:preprotein translocase subunit SecD [Bradyrhizobium shewense]
MTTPLRNRITRLIAAFAIASTIALPRAALAADGQLDKMRAKIAAFITDKMEKLGGSRIIYKVDRDALREAVTTDLRDDV